MLEAFAVSHGKASPYLPLIELLKTYFQIDPADDERSRRERIIGKILGLDRSLEASLPYFFSLLGIADVQANLQQMDAQIRRKRTFEALKKLFLRETLNQPLLLVFEDLHWIDSETQGFLDTLSESVASAQLLVLVNYRPEYRHEWGGKTYYTQLRLAALGKAEAEELLTFLLGNDMSLTQLKALILERTEGTPFFMEEVVQTLVEEGALIGERGSSRLETTPTELHISLTVQGVLAARIDRLTGEEKELLQQLSVIGRQFPVSLVKHVVQQPEAELYRVLSSLQAKEFLYEQPAFPEVEYLFKHALTQEVAYSTVLQEQRKALHEQTGQAMEVLYQESLDEHYGELTYQYQQSGNTEKVVTYAHLAGQQAIQRSADEDAIRYLTTALEFLTGLAAGPAQSQRELGLLTTLGATLMRTRGFGAPEVETAYSRARELCEQVGETAQLFPVLYGLSTVYFTRAEYVPGRQRAEQLLTLAQQSDDPVYVPAAHFLVGVNLLLMGQLFQTRAHFGQGIALLDVHAKESQASLYGYGHSLACRAFGSFTLWLLGYPDQARQMSHEALSLAHDLAQPFGQSIALVWAALLENVLRDGQTAEAHAAAGASLSTDQGFAFFAAYGTLMRGRALAELGQVEAGLVQLHQGLSAYRATQSKNMVSGWLAQLTEVYWQTGRVEAGLATAAEALAVVEEQGERWWEAELYRLKGELTLQAEGQCLAAQAAACFEKAITVAHQQQAKSWELRAVTSLARLRQSQGKQAEAQKLLSDIYNWFTEGFDTADLQDAKALLAELSEGV